MPNTIRTFTMITLLSATLSVGLMACGSSDPEPQRVEINVGMGEYSPSEVHATAGTPLTLVFTRTSEEGCGTEVVIASQNIRQALPLNEPVEVSFTPTEAGTLRFSCGMDMFEGSIVVD